MDKTTMKNESSEFKVDESNLIVGVDIGSSNIGVSIGALTPNDSVKLLGVGNVPLSLDGNNDLETTKNALKNAVQNAELTSGFDIKKVYVGIGGSGLHVVQGTGKTNIETNEVRQIDIENAVKSAMPPNQASGEVVHAFRVNFYLDDQEQPYKNPLGMICSRLTANVNVVLAPKNVLDNVRQCIVGTGLELEGFVLESYAAGLAVLYPDDPKRSEEMELGVAVLDIGSHSSDLAIFSNECLLHCASLPVGGYYVTRDIASSLEQPISITRAEEIKKEHGTCLLTNLVEDDFIQVPGLAGRGDISYPRKQLALVIRERMKQIFKLYADYLKKNELLDKLNAGIVLTGGCASIEGVDKLAEEVFGKIVRVGHPVVRAGLSGNIRPADSVRIGLLEFGARELAERRSSTKKLPVAAVKGIGGRILELLKSLV